MAGNEVNHESRYRTVSIFHATIALLLFVGSLMLGAYGFHIAGFNEPELVVISQAQPSLMPPGNFYAPSVEQPQVSEVSGSASSPSQLADFYMPATGGSEQVEMLPPAPMDPANIEVYAYVPDRIVIPAIKVDSPVVDVGWRTVTDSRGSVFNLWDVADFAAGWHVTSDQPGQGGNVVLSGHNNMRGAVFRRLNKLKEGDVATIWSGYARYDYKIDEVVILRERGMPMKTRLENAQWIGEFDDNRLTLVSCWPPRGNSHRIIVVGHFVGEIDDGTRTPAMVY